MAVPSQGISCQRLLNESAQPIGVVRNPTSQVLVGFGQGTILLIRGPETPRRECIDQVAGQH